jgi:hypothetical protein
VAATARLGADEREHSELPAIRTRSGVIAGGGFFLRYGVPVTVTVQAQFELTLTST